MIDGHDTTAGLLALLFALGSVGALEAQESGRASVLTFGPRAVETWYVVNDGVMGGRSSSEMRHEAGDTAVFEGNLSLENNGGFASVRTEVAEGSLAGATALRLAVRGDGKRYQLRLRMSRSFDGVAYAAGFETIEGEWTTVEIPLDQFRATFRGFAPRDVQALEPERVRQIGLMLTDKQVGPFRLEVAGLDAVRESR